MEENELIPVDNNNAVEYTDDNIRHLSDMEHVRTRPGMYIGRLGDGAHAEDGIYVLLKELTTVSTSSRCKPVRKSKLPLKRTSASAYATTDEASRRESW